MLAAVGCAHQAKTTQAAAEPTPVVEHEQAQVEVQPIDAKPATKEAKACPIVRVGFATDSDVIPDIDKPMLDQAASCLKDEQRLRVEVEGNADERGTQEYNFELGQRRSNAVVSYLEGQGVASDRLKAISFGKDRPRCTGHDESCWQHNRVAAIAPTCHL
jgi:peptidoglycan-associated lipoprotein